jgi:hypothetical protein
MRSAVGHEPGEGGMLVEPTSDEARRRDGEPELPVLDDLPRSSPRPPPEDDNEPAAKPDRGRISRLPSLAPDPTPGEERSRFDATEGVVYYNDTHSDYLLVKDDEPGLLDYLATLVAKEYVVYNNPMATPGDISEELVRMLVRVRRHLPRRR